MLRRQLQWSLDASSHISQRSGRGECSQRALVCLQDLPTRQDAHKRYIPLSSTVIETLKLTIHRNIATFNSWGLSDFDFGNTLYKIRIVVGSPSTLERVNGRPAVTKRSAEDATGYLHFWRSLL